MNHKLPALTELMQTNMQICREHNQAFRFRQAAKDIPVFALLPAGWHVACPAHANADDAAGSPGDSTPLHWAKTVVVACDSTLPQAIRLLDTYSYLLVADAAGEPVGYLERASVLQAVFTAYEVLEAYFDTMIQTMDASISVIDEQARVMVWTEGAERIFSLKAKDILGRPITDFSRATCWRRSGRCKTASRCTVTSTSRARTSSCSSTPSRSTCMRKSSAPSQPKPISPARFG
ncbi:transcriptional regulator [Brevibacillus agri BAB-2500]|nr:transcriptional regulator [Brevibacillus agri BAB-2500]